MRTAAPLCKCGCGEAVTWFTKRSRWHVYVQGHYRSDADYKQREWLLMQYDVLQLTLEEIAAMFGVNATTICKQMKRHGIARRNRSEAIAGRLAGHRNPAWRGGVTPERQRLYKTAAWKELVKSCFARDSYRCVRCGSGKVGGRKLHAHHIRPWSVCPEKRMSLDNVTTLCDVCHLWVHSTENARGEFLAA